MGSAWRVWGAYYTVPRRRARCDASRPFGGDVVPYANLAQMFFTRAHELADRPRYRHRDDTGWHEVTWAETRDRVRAIAAALIEDGVRPGDRIALLSATRPEWMEIDFAILACGALTIPVYPSVLPDECGYIVTNAGADRLFVDNAKQRAKVEAITRDGFELDGVRRPAPVRSITSVEGTGPETLGATLERGRSLLGRHGSEIDRRVAALGRSDLATIVYTSGTTGPPKGVPQTHGNHLAAVEAALRIGTLRAGDVDFFFLPLAHSFARMIEYCGIAAGTTTVFARSIDTLIDDLPTAKPNVVPAVPRVYEKMYARIQAGRAASGTMQQTLFDWAVGVGRQRSRLRAAGRPVPLWLQAADAIAHQLVFSRIHAVLGGNIRFMLSGGAPLAPEIAEFFHAVGVPIFEGYGLTETTPVLTVNHPEKYRLGTVGTVLDCCEIRIAEDGEILARGANVAGGYYERPEATAEAWDGDGWFHTGDIGEIDADGFLRITDRKKDLLKTSGGKYVAPQKIENLLKLQPHISQAVVIGDNRKYCTALVTLDFAEIERWAAGQGLQAGPAALTAHPSVQALIEGEVAAVNQHLPSWESIKYVRVLPGDFSPETGELTPSLKVKRKVVGQRYADVIESMYR
ncbi:MAG: AMP-dependent synthetase/ligase [Candidatus Binatia bacterium]